MNEEEFEQFGDNPDNYYTSQYVIKSITITASASKSYQKNDVSVTVENAVPDDIPEIQAMVNQCAEAGVNDLASRIDSKPVSQPSRQVAPSYGRTTVQQQVTNVKPVSDKQRMILRQNGYADDVINSMDSKTASELIGQIINGQ